MPMPVTHGLRQRHFLFALLFYITPALSLLGAQPVARAQADAVFPVRPHLAKQVRYEGLLAEQTCPTDEVELLDTWPKGLAPLGRATLIIADRLEPNSESAEFLLKKTAARLGANVVMITSMRDVTKNFRSLTKERRRGVSALEEFEVAAIVAKANMQGGQLRVGKLRFFVTAADRYGDSEVTGTFHLTLSHNDTLQWSIGRVGPRYKVERKTKHLSRVTGPSGKIYDVRIVGRRAKVYPANSKSELRRSREQKEKDPKDNKAQLYYAEFSIMVALRPQRP